MLGDGRVEVLPLDESYVYAFVLHHGGKRFLIANVLFINSLERVWEPSYII